MIISKGVSVALPKGPNPSGYQLKHDASGPVIDYNNGCLFTVEQDVSATDSQNYIYTISKIDRVSGAIIAQVEMSLLDQGPTSPEYQTGLAVDSSGYVYVCTYTYTGSSPFPNRLYKYDNNLNFVASVQLMSSTGVALDSAGGEFLIPVDTLAGSFIFAYAGEDAIVVFNRSTMALKDTITPTGITSPSNLAWGDKNGDIWVVCKTSAGYILEQIHYNADGTHTETQHNINTIVTTQAGLNYQAWYDPIDHAIVLGGNYEGSASSPTTVGHSFYKIDLSTITVTATLDITHGTDTLLYYPSFVGVERSRDPQGFGPGGTGHECVLVAWYSTSTGANTYRLVLIDHKLNLSDLTQAAFGVASWTGGSISWSADNTATDPIDLVYDSAKSAIWTWQPASFYWSVGSNETTTALERFDVTSGPVTLSGTWQYPDGTPVANGKLFLRLSQDAQISGSGGQVSGRSYVVVNLDANGNVPANTTVWGNDSLLPLGTTYSCFVTAPGGARVWGRDQVAITGSNFNLTSFVPATPQEVGLGQ